MIIQIGDILVSEEVLTECFECNYEDCKGICCIKGDAGAPLEESEMEELERDYKSYSGNMSAAGRQAVDEKGFFEVDRDGDIVTPVVSGTEECAYTHFDKDGNCLCAIEKCHLEGLCRFRKPISCQLYPIRVSRLTGGGQALNLHRWDICSGAFEKGRRNGKRVYQFLKDPLIRAYGEEFYEALCAAAAAIDSGEVS